MLYYAPLLITAANSMTLNHILSTLQDIPLFYIYDASFVFARPTIELLFFRPCSHFSPFFLLILFNPRYAGSQNTLFTFTTLSISSHSLSFHLLYNYSELTIFNFFNFVACEFSVESYRMEIFRVFEGLAMCCILAVYKCIEERLKKDGVLVVGKRRLFPKKRRVSGAKTSFSESKDFVFF